MIEHKSTTQKNYFTLNSMLIFRKTRTVVVLLRLGLLGILSLMVVMYHPNQQQNKQLDNWSFNSSQITKNSHVAALEAPARPVCTLDFLKQLCSTSPRLLTIALLTN